MEPIDSGDSETIGWHLIARGGDMTARVHPAMQLGILPSGDLSFEAPDAVVQLDLKDEALTLEIVADDYELELEAGERIQTLRVGAQTHVRLDFLGHTLDIDNDFAVASPPGDGLALYVVRKGEPRQPLGPLSASAHPLDTDQEGEILVSERSSVTPLKAVPVDYLQREHAAAARDKRQAQDRRSSIRKVTLALAASVLVVAGLVVTALYVASLSVEEALTAGSPTASPTEQAGEAGVAPPETDPLTSAATAGGQQMVNEQVAPVGGVSQEVLARLSALLDTEPLPDKATVDFAIESLRSLMVAYPDDPRIPAALAELNERLVLEARQSYDQGDAFRAGRLIEQATTLGMATASVAATLDYFAEQPPGSALAAQAGVDSSPQAGADAATQPAADEAAEAAVTEAEAEAMLIAALAQEEAAATAASAAADPAEPVSADAGVPAAADSELNALVESATGLALGALAVEVIVEDIDPVEAPQETDPVLAALGPALPLIAETDGVESRLQLALDSYLEESLAAAEVVSANDLPDGFAVEETLAGSAGAATDEPPAGAAPASVPAGPAFRSYSDLTPVRQAPLVYPERAQEGSEGSIDVQFIVTETGRVIEVEVSGEAPAIFLREATRTIRTWRFAPVRENGEAVSVRTALRVTYRS